MQVAQIEPCVDELYLASMYELAMRTVAQQHQLASKPAHKRGTHR
jgi:hypothetical protein